MTPEITTQNGVLTAEDLIRQAQYALAAAYLLVNNKLGIGSAHYFARQVRLSEDLSSDLRQHRDSAAHRAARLALGMLMRPQIARDCATTECTALLEQSDALKNSLADGEWEECGAVLSRNIIDAYHAALLEATQ